MTAELARQERQHHGLEPDHVKRDEYGFTERESIWHALFVVAAWHKIAQRRADYALECEADRRNGHRPHYCIHGTNQWTDYDNICGGCEDSLSDAEWADVVAHGHVHAVMLTMLTRERMHRPGWYDRAQILDQWLADDVAAGMNPHV
jgi:hypothetical protein